MRRALLTFASWLLAGPVNLTTAALAQEATPARPAIVLNGITTILGDKLACFKVTFADGTPPASFLLAEGQSRYGVQLVAVDVQSNAVTIHNAGLAQVIAICQTPELPVGGPNAAAFGENFAGSVGAQDLAGRLKSQADASSAGKSREEGGDPNSSANAGSDSSSPSATRNQVYQWWVQDAQKIENARQQTAQRVLAGEWQPYPLTPLTPPGTPAALIGANSLFFNHGPGMIIAGQ